MSSDSTKLKIKNAMPAAVSSLDVVSDGLNTGDLILFSHRPSIITPPWGGVANFLFQSILTNSNNNTFHAQHPVVDHVGIIIIKNFIPHVLEYANNSIKPR